MRRLGLLALLTLTGCSTAPVTNLLDHFAPSRYEAGGDVPRRPRPKDDELIPPSVLPVPARGNGRRIGSSEPVPELSSPFPPR